jgi:hypothetical protein
MLVKVYTSANDCKELETSKTFLKEILNELKQTFGEELTNEILYNKYFYFLNLGDTIVGIEEELLGSELDGYKELIIVKDVEGNLPVLPVIAAMASTVGGAVATGVSMASVAMGFGALSATALSAIVTVVGGLVQAGIMMGVSYGLNALFAPDTSFKGDPSKSQGKQSKIFNNAPVVREQGGSVPIIYGNPYCGGVLISSSISSEDVKK